LQKREHDQSGRGEQGNTVVGSATEQHDRYKDIHQQEDEIHANTGPGVEVQRETMCMEGLYVTGGDLRASRKSIQHVQIGKICWEVGKEHPENQQRKGYPSDSRQGEPFSLQLCLTRAGMFNNAC
jgi:hypothetical protein